jgi:hypothetical protein
MTRIMPLAGESPPFPAPPAAAPERPGWLRWLGFNLWLLACVLIAVGLALALLGALLGQDEDDPWWNGYVWMCLFLPVTWPLYMAALAFATRRGRHPRRWAVGLVPLLFALFPYAVFTFTAPGVGAAWVAFFTYGAIVRLPPGTGSHPDPGPPRD